MKKLFVGLWSLFLCGAIQAQQPLCTLEGTAPLSFNGKSIEVYTGGGGHVNKVGSALVQNGKFEYRTAIDKNKLYYLYYTNAAEKTIEIKLVLDAEKIQVNFTDSSCVVAGSPLTSSYKNFNSQLHKRFASKNDSIQFICDFVQKNTDNAVGKDAYAQSLIRFSRWVGDSTYFFKVYNIGSEVLKKKFYPRMMTMENKVYWSKFTGKFLDFNIYTEDNKSVSFSEVFPKLIGDADYLQVIFWASWCGPCKAAIPSHKQKYGKEKVKMEYVSISLDSDYKTWKEELIKQQMPWKQFMIKSGQNIGKLYHFNSIPFSIYIDKKGHIASDVHSLLYSNK